MIGPRWALEKRALHSDILALMAACMLSGAFSSTAFGAQQLTGVVQDAQSERMIGSVTVRLLDHHNRLVASAITPETGRFEFVGYTEGEYRLQVEAFGYAAGLLGPIRLDGGRTDVIIRMAVDAVQLDALTVAGDVEVPWLSRVGYYARKELGHGRYIERAEISERNPNRLSDMLRSVPGLRVLRGPRGIADVGLRASNLVSFSKSNAHCLPQVFLDGMLISHNKGERYDLNALRPMDVEAIEIYAGPAQVPPQYGGAHSACGVVLIWTRK